MSEPTCTVCGQPRPYAEILARAEKAEKELDGARRDAEKWRKRYDDCDVRLTCELGNANKRAYDEKARADRLAALLAKTLAFSECWPSGVRAEIEAEIGKGK